jgi:outer membrane protease
MKSLSVLSAGIALAAVCTASTALAQDFDMTLAEGGVTFSGSVGIIGLEAKEWVFAGPGSTDHLSLLIWQSMAPVLTTGLDVTLPDGWTIIGSAQIAKGGDSYMEDYDWYGPDFIDYEDGNWTHRSQSDDTNLDWYFNGSVALGKDLAVSDQVTVNLRGGFKYTDVQWTAVGGSYVYSDQTIDNPGNNFRAYSGALPDGPGITYRQQLPALFAGLDTEIVHDAWTFGFGAQVGVIFHGVATDDHWLLVPPRRFIDSLDIAPTAALSASVEYAVTDQVNVSLAGTVDKVFLARGDSQYDDGVLTGSCTNCIGAELISGTVTAGIKGTF